MRLTVLVLVWQTNAAWAAAHACGDIPRTGGFGDIPTETLTVLADAIADATPPQGASPGMVEQLLWNVQRLTAGTEISERER